MLDLVPWSGFDPHFLQQTSRTLDVLGAISCVVMGISHIVQPQLWKTFFAHLHSLGATGVVLRTFVLELWFALALVVLHPVTSGPGVVVTVYGWLLFTKCVVSVLRPQMALKSLALAEKGAPAFIGAGVMLLVVGGCAAASAAT